MAITSVLSLAVAQPVTISHDVVANVGAHSAIVEAAEADLVVFPELSLTGYHFDAEPIPADDPRLWPLVDACRRSRTTALVGAPVADGELRHIAVLAVDPGGASVVYRKMYLGDDEVAHFAPGPGPSALDVNGWRIGLAVCKDTGVEAQVAATAALGIDVYAAGALEHAADADVQPFRARRIIDAHRVWVALACFAGSTGEGFASASGGSSIWRPDGSQAASAGPEPGAIARFELLPDPSGL
ncbi:MAG: carbon-nitrogen hydrolase family protein [Acidimicrobiia bacterium]|nr:carbon-nitrogen hydrolase family protein [Acidimicrobiia bacterium]